MEDLLGFGKGTDKLLDVVSRGIGVLYRPRSMRAEADARAYETRVLGAASLDVEKAKAALELSMAIQSKHAMSEADAQLATRARDRLVQTEIQRQRNVEAIVQMALEAPPADASEEAVDDDWTRTLFRFGQEVSDTTMQRLWAQLLNGEVAQPGTYSVRALQALSMLSKAEVSAFQKLCRMCDATGRIFVPPNITDDDWLNRRSNWFKPHGLEDATLEVLQEAGLVADGIHTLAAVHMVNRDKTPRDCIVLRLRFAGSIGVFTCLDSGRRTLELKCLRLTTAGRELARLTDADFDRTYPALVAATYDLAFRYED